MSGRAADFLVIGGGIVGMTAALEARRRHPGARVVLIEKEDRPGLHASGRNSGVLHAGFYYSADTLKARFTREGNRRLAAYCRERGLTLNPCGKLVVARDERELERLDELARRGQVNGVELVQVSEAEARRIEPRARTFRRALFSPTTASVDPGEVMASLARDARAAGIDLRAGTAYLSRRHDRIRTSRGELTAGYVINAAGLYADAVARDFGFCDNHRILPFKGVYLHAGVEPGWLRTHVYPVPDMDYPFLGVHLTVTATGGVKIGPTAMPAFWREHYGGVAGFRAGEFLEVAARETALLLSNRFGFRRLAWHELRKYSRRALVREAERLADGVARVRAWRRGPAGIRAQLFDLRERRLEMDFRCEGDERSFHVLNAVSPAFTCALPFAEYVLDTIEGRTAAQNHPPPPPRAAEAPGTSATTSS